MASKDFLDSLLNPVEYEKEKLLEAWNKVMHKFRQPLLHNLPETYEHLPIYDTAHFDFATLRTRISRNFVEQLIWAGSNLEEMLEGILSHEVGHYALHPRNAKHMLYYGHILENIFRQKWDDIYNYYSDICNNMMQMMQEKKGKSVRNLYKTMHKVAEMKIAAAPDPDAEKKAKRLDELITAYYQRQTGDDFGVNLDSSLDDKMKGLMAIDFNSSEYEEVKIISFGNIIQDLLDLEQGSGKGSGLGNISMDDFSDGQINDALDKIAKEKGIERYKMVRGFAEKITRKKFDNCENKNSGKLAGLGKVDEIERNDDLVPYYDRLSRNSGIYIIDKPVFVDTIDNYPNENVEFSPSDPLNRLNKFSTGGRIFPGITKRHKEGSGKKKDRSYRIPDCYLVFDTSGSMLHPNSKSPAHESGFTLAKNYHANGAKVGVINFSTDSMVIPPTRNLDTVFKALCAYWGGGTVLDTEKLHKYIMHYKMLTDGIIKQKDLEKITTAEDYERLMGRMSRNERKQFEKKAGINIKIKAVQEAYSKLDTHIITDGEIYNIPEIVDYFNNIGMISRNAIYVISNPKQYSEWSEMQLPNTQVFNVENIEDLQGVVIGRIKKLRPIKRKSHLFE